MLQETRQCQNCKQNFTIEPDDFDFYAKMKVPPPTWCPDCRFLRRMSWRNERTLYRRTCGLCGKRTISNWSEEAAPIVYCHDCWWGDGWDPLKCGTNYDFSRPFFVQYMDMVIRIPHLNLWAFSNVSSEYANYTAYCKDAYLSYSILYSEDIMYSSHTDKSFHCVDCYKTFDSQYCYSTVNSQRCYNVRFAVNSKDCVNSAFLFACANCQDCFMCTNLRNKQYCIRNKSLTKEEYAAELSKIKTASSVALEDLQNEFDRFMQSSIHKYANLIQVTNVTGDNVTNSKNAHVVFDAENAENVKYCWRLRNYKDSYDISGAIDSELSYEVCVGGDKNYGCKFYIHSSGMRNTSYIQYCPDSSDLFGCFGIKRRQYCIFNRQYTKEQYEELVPRIIEHMNAMPYIDHKGRIYKYGEFFPLDLSPFAYNESLVQEHFPLTKEQALDRGHRWKDPDAKEYVITKKPGDLPDHIEDVPDSIVNDVIGCAHEGKCTHQCTTAFKIISEELAFYHKMNLPLPRLCPNCRHYERLKQRNPLKLWHRTCMCDKTAHIHGTKKCQNEFETSCAPYRKEAVYCEQCYNAEVV